jgi:hypothetical protein
VRRHPRYRDGVGGLDSLIIMWALHISLAIVMLFCLRISSTHSNSLLCMLGLLAESLKSNDIIGFSVSPMNSFDASTEPMYRLHMFMGRGEYPEIARRDSGIRGHETFLAN